MPIGGRKRPPAAVLSSSLVLPGGLDAADVLRGTSAVTRLPPEHNPGIGAPVTAPLEAPADFPYAMAPRALLLALEAAARLERESGPRYGLVLALSCLHAEPPYIEHMLAHHREADRMPEIYAYCADFPLEYLASRPRCHRTSRARRQRLRLGERCAWRWPHEWLELGVVDDVIVVAASSMVDPIGLTLFRNLRALERRGRRGGQPPLRSPPPRLRHGRGCGRRLAVDPPPPRRRWASCAGTAAR